MYIERERERHIRIHTYTYMYTHIHAYLPIATNQVAVDRTFQTYALALI